MTSYTVKVESQRSIPTGAKLTLELVNDDTGEVVLLDKIGLETWQLQEGLDRRLEEWKKRRLKQLDETEPDVTGREV